MVDYDTKKKGKKIANEDAVGAEPITVVSSLVHHAPYKRLSFLCVMTSALLLINVCVLILTFVEAVNKSYLTCFAFGTVYTVTVGVVWIVIVAAFAICPPWYVPVSSTKEQYVAPSSRHTVDMWCFPWISLALFGLNVWAIWSWYTAYDGLIDGASGRYESWHTINNYQGFYEWKTVMWIFITTNIFCIIPGVRTFHAHMHPESLAVHSYSETP